MIPVFMDNNVGGIVYVGKNELAIRFASGIEHVVRINTKELLQLLESRSAKEWETGKFLIEPMHLAQDGALLVIITVKFTRQDDDKATVFRCDLVEALKKIEGFALVG